MKVISRFKGLCFEL